MDGLRVFVDQDLSKSQACQVFYSRRGDGPLYRWSFVEVPKHWQAKRIKSSELTTRELSSWTWKNVPPLLQRILKEHYQD